MAGLIPPTAKNHYRENAYLASNGITLMNASTMFYGGAKTGKTRLIIESFDGLEYIFLDFDRNYESTIKGIEESNAIYYNGENAYDVLLQFMNGTITDSIVVIDALGSVVKRLAVEWNRLHPDEIPIDTKYIGVSHEATVDFFNKVVEPMTAGNNSVNFIHHTTQNATGEKMEGNKGAWLSVFDFTYSMDRASKTFRLEAGRLPVAPNTIGSDNIYDRINRKIKDEAEMVDFGNTRMLVVKLNRLTSTKAFRPILNGLDSANKLKVLKVPGSKTEYLDASLLINSNGQFLPTST